MGLRAGKAKDVQYAFDQSGHGAIVNSSRGIMCAWQKTGDTTGRDYRPGSPGRGAERMRDDICRYVTIL